MDWYIGTEWKMERKGLRKEVLDMNFTALIKPLLVSEVVIKVHDVQNLNLGCRTSKYLAQEQLGKEQQLEMGTALTPVDYYVEILVRQLIIGERARCFIRTKNDAEEITFELTLEKILRSKYFHKLRVPEIYELALRYKDNGVVMFKDYPLFAHDYFRHAAKCLISCKPFDSLTEEGDGVAGKDMQALLIQIQTNLAACLLAQGRYDDVLYHTQFVETLEDPSDKSLYRRALAFLHIKEFEKALKAIQRIPNYHDKKECVKVLQSIDAEWKESNNQYKDIVQRMFS